VAPGFCPVFRIAALWHTPKNIAQKGDAAE
jgi:hypothetical protein